MRRIQSAITLISALAVLILPAQSAMAQSTETKTELQAQTNVTLQKPSWQTVLDKLFGTPESGLLDGKTPFQFTADDLKLTSDQAAAFFSSSSTSTQDFAALIEAATALRGKVRFDGTIDGRRFEMKLAGRELKLDGLSLTPAQREALLADLRGIDGLRQVKLEALVDGRETRIVVAGGKERISLERGERPENGRGDDKQKLERPPKIEIERRDNSDHRVETDRRVRIDTRIEREGRGGGKPELPRLGK